MARYTGVEALNAAPWAMTAPTSVAVRLLLAERVS
jgi:hypothetical protein